MGNIKVTELDSESERLLRLNEAASRIRAGLASTSLGAASAVSEDRVDTPERVLPAQPGSPDSPVSSLRDEALEDVIRLLNHKIAGYRNLVKEAECVSLSASERNHAELEIEGMEAFITEVRALISKPDSPDSSVSFPRDEAAIQLLRRISLHITNRDAVSLSAMQQEIDALIKPEGNSEPVTYDAPFDARCFYCRNKYCHSDSFHFSEIEMHGRYHGDQGE